MIRLHHREMKRTYGHFASPSITIEMSFRNHDDHPPHVLNHAEIIQTSCEPPSRWLIYRSAPCSCGANRVRFTLRAAASPPFDAQRSVLSTASPSCGSTTLPPRPPPLTKFQTLLNTMPPRLHSVSFQISLFFPWPPVVLPFVAPLETGVVLSFRAFWSRARRSLHSLRFSHLQWT
ncbi:hypothetical protein BJX96DRAFT_76562 [Aspergillus floccosus]